MPTLSVSVCAKLSLPHPLPGAACPPVRASLTLRPGSLLTTVSSPVFPCKPFPPSGSADSALRGVVLLFVLAGRCLICGQRRDEREVLIKEAVTVVANRDMV